MNSCEEGPSSKLSYEDQLHVLAVDDNIVDRKLIEKLLKTSSFKGNIYACFIFFFLFLALSKGRTTFGCANGARRRCSLDGPDWYPFYEGTRVLAAPAWHRALYRWFVPLTLFARRVITTQPR